MSMVGQSNVGHNVPSRVELNFVNCIFGNGRHIGIVYLIKMQSGKVHLCSKLNRVHKLWDTLNQLEKDKKSLKKNYEKKKKGYVDRIKRETSEK